jgi:hypothetical protein
MPGFRGNLKEAAAYRKNTNFFGVYIFSPHRDVLWVAPHKK